MSIDPAAYGSSTSTFALRNLHKSQGGRIGTLPLLSLACGLRLSPHSSDWCRFRAAGRRSDALSTCRRNVGVPAGGAPASSSSPRGGAMMSQEPCDILPFRGHSSAKRHDVAGRAARRRAGAPVHRWRPVAERPPRRRPGQNPPSLEGGITENRPPWSKPAFTGGKPPHSTRKPAAPHGRTLRPSGKTPAQEAALGCMVKTGVFCTYSEGGF